MLAGTAIAVLVIQYAAIAAGQESNSSDATSSNALPIAVKNVQAGYGNPVGQQSGTPSPQLSTLATNTNTKVQAGMKLLQPASQPRLSGLQVSPQAHDGRVFGSNTPSLGLSHARMPNREAVFAAARASMVTNQIAGAGRGITKPEILDAMNKVPRHQFVPAQSLADAYQDKPLEVAQGRTIESPFVVATVADQLDPKPTDRVLEIGTGYGYQTAVLSCLVKEVYTVESSEYFAECAKSTWQRLGYTNNISIRQGDIALGWPEAAPFDAIVVNNGSNQISDAVIKQLKEGGRMILPAISDGNLHVMRKTGSQMNPLVTRDVRLPAMTSEKVQLRLPRQIEGLHNETNAMTQSGTNVLKQIVH